MLPGGGGWGGSIYQCTGTNLPTETLSCSGYDQATLEEGIQQAAPSMRSPRLSALQIRAVIDKKKLGAFFSGEGSDSPAAMVTTETQSSGSKPLLMAPMAWEKGVQGQEGD